MLLLKPRSILQISPSNPLNSIRPLGGVKVFDFLRRDTGVDGVGLATHIRGHHRSGANDDVGFNNGIVHHNRSHSNQDRVVNSTAVDDSSVTDADIVADVRSGPLVGSVDNCTVLNIDPVAADDGVHVSAHNGGVPDGAIVAQDDFTNQGSIFGKEAVFAVGRDVSANGDY